LVHDKKLEVLIDDYLSFLKNSKCCTREIIQIFEIPLRQMRDNCYWIEKDDKIILDITPFRHIIEKNGKRAFVKKIKAIKYFVSYLRDNLGLNVVLKGGIDSIDIEKVDDLESILEELSIKEKLLLTLFYGMNLKLVEIISLKRDMVDLKRALINLPDGGELKISNKLKNIFFDYFKAYPVGEFLFESESGAYTVNSLRNKLQKASKETKLPQKQIRSSINRYISSQQLRSC
jgi:site-specific recombinase XerC